MRPSNKTAILHAAVQVIQTEGITAVTFDSVAAAAGLTRGGILYHFPSRDDLLGAIHQYLAEQWDQQIEARCGKSAAEATPTERLAAYIRVAAHGATRADLQMLLDSGTSEQHRQHWTEVIARWTPQGDLHTTGTIPDTHWVALLAADGLWINEAINEDTVPSDRRARLAETIVDLLTA